MAFNKAVPIPFPRYGGKTETAQEGVVSST